LHDSIVAAGSKAAWPLPYGYCQQRAKKVGLCMSDVDPPAVQVLYDGIRELHTRWGGDGMRGGMQ